VCVCVELMFFSFLDHYKDIILKIKIFTKQLFIFVLHENDRHLLNAQLKLRIWWAAPPPEPTACNIKNDVFMDFLLAVL